jgi:hypothetical protein
MGNPVIARIATEALPFSIDWRPDGRLLVIDGPRRLLLGQEPDGALAAVADLTPFGSAPSNELVVDAAGHGRRLARRAARRLRGSLGGKDGRTLFIAAAEWRGMEAALSEGPGRTGRLLAAPGQPAPHAGRP